MAENRYDLSGLEILAFVAVIVMMRGCYHAGVIAEKVNPGAYELPKQGQAGER